MEFLGKLLGLKTYKVTDVNTGKVLYEGHSPSKFDKTHGGHGENKYVYDANGKLISHKQRDSGDPNTPVY